LSDPLEVLKEVLSARYRVERELGRGGMAVVYLAEDLKHRRKVALKVLKPELARAIGSGRFLQEIAIAAGLNHPNILPLHDSGEAGGLLYYVMPYVAGESLGDRLRREKQLSIPEALGIVQDVAAGLSHAHRAGIIHRDIKPTNILLASGRAVVSDFGIARAIGEAGGQDLTEPGLVLGTPAYMSPEQAAGVTELDARTDIYSLGCVLYEMLAGQPPFTGSSAAALLARKAIDTVPRLRVVRDAVPQAMEDVLLRALAKVPADRFVTVEEFAEALVTPGLPASAAPISPAARARRLWGVGVGLAVLMATGAAAWTVAHRGTGLVPDRVVVNLFENRTRDPTLDPLASMTADWLTDGIQHLGSIEVVPTTATLFLASDLRAGKTGSTDPTGGLRRLVEETGAGLVVTGAYYRLGDSLQFRARIVNARSGTAIRIVDPVTGSVERPLEVIEALREKVLGALAAHLDVAMGELAQSPPAYTAYKPYLEGLKLFSQLRVNEAIPRLDSAIALDSTFTSALFISANVQATAGQFARYDSSLDRLERLRGRMSAAETHYLDWMQALRRGDLTEALHALREAARLTPNPGTRYMVGVFGLRANRPGEALRVLPARDRQSLFWRTWSWTWQVPTEAYHLLGDHRRELKEARRGRQQHPDLLATMYNEVLALAGLGEIEAVQSLLHDALALAPQPVWTYGSLAANAALELRVHGHPESARTVLQGAMEWYRERLTEHPGQGQLRFELARCLYWSGRWDEARVLFDTLLSEVPESGAPWHGLGTASDFDYLGFLGVIAARQGHSADALRLSERLAAITRPHLFGYPTLWRARIAALMGDPERAVGLLRQAISQGVLPGDLAQGLGYPMLLHRDIDLESMRDYPPFQELLRPKG
jgi:tetratricopeptide (TPR) repeat protein/predicted Ser/Thr protein kinase